MFIERETVQLSLSSIGGACFLIEFDLHFALGNTPSPHQKKRPPLRQPPFILNGQGAVKHIWPTGLGRGVEGSVASGGRRQGPSQPHASAFFSREARVAATRYCRGSVKCAILATACVLRFALPDGIGFFENRCIGRVRSGQERSGNRRKEGIGNFFERN